jgi:hypothetical protein
VHRPPVKWFAIDEIVINTDLELLYLYFETSNVPGKEIRPLTEDRGYNNVLLGQDCHTTYGAVIAMVRGNGEMTIGG